MVIRMANGELRSRVGRGRNALYWTVAELAEYLDFSQQTIRAMIRRGELPAIEHTWQRRKPGFIPRRYRRWLVPDSGVREWERQKLEAVSTALSRRK
jgi:hypothetical protein